MAYVRAADDARATGNPALEAHLLRRAVPGLREYGAADEVPDLLARAREAQAIAPFKDVRTSSDFTATIETVREQFTGLPRQNALFELAAVYRSPDIVKLRSTAISLLNKSLARRLFGVDLTTGDGRKLTTIGPASPDFPHGEGDERLIRFEMASVSHDYRRAAARLVDTARTCIRNEHVFTLRELLEVARRSALVPKGHETLVARGLLAGLNGDLEAHSGDA